MEKIAIFVSIVNVVLALGISFSGHIFVPA